MAAQFLTTDKLLQFVLREASGAFDELGFACVVMAILGRVEEKVPDFRD